MNEYLTMGMYFIVIVVVTVVLSTVIHFVCKDGCLRKDK